MIYSAIKSTAPFLALLLVSVPLLSSCSIEEMRQNDKNRLMDFTHSKGIQEKFDQLDGLSHMAKGMSYLKKSGESSHDLYFARSAFERAAILQVDNPAPYFLAGFTNFKLGNYDAAYSGFLNAAWLDQTSDGWWLAALSALRQTTNS